MADRESTERLRERGWTEPLRDGSPVERPRGWTGGSVENTGGHVMCRIWRHAEDPVEVLYNLDDENVSIIWTEGPDGGYCTEPVGAAQGVAADDESLAHVAAGLMIAYNNGQVDPPGWEE